MADLSYRNDPLAIRRTSWGAIWAGIFCTYAIWAVFESLGMAIFASAGTTNAVGMGIWSVVLTCIAFYVGGHITGRLANVSGRHEGTIHGVIMFGLAIVGAIVLVSLAGAVLSGGQGAQGASTQRGWTTLADLGWGGFVSLFLGWIFAMIGGSAGAGSRRDRVESIETHREQRDVIRPAA
jgi:hypothetical protein